jgi:hypothetical protein
VDRSDGAQGTQLRQRGRVAEVAGVDDQVGGAQDLDARLRQTAVAARQMRI